MPIRSFASSIAQPVGVQITGTELEAASCQQTVYDNVDDYAYSSETALTSGLTGEQTWCCEFYFESDTEHHYAFSNADNGGTTGMNWTFYPNPGVLGFFCTLYSASGFRQAFIKSPSSPTGSWKKVVLVAASSSLNFWVDGVQSNEYAGTGSFTAGTPTSTFKLGADRTASDTLNGKLRNVEIYSGAASNPTEWVPGDTSSLTGTTLVMDSADGSGENNSQGLSFTIVGDPTQEDCD